MEILDKLFEMTAFGELAASPIELIDASNRDTPFIPGNLEKI